MTYCPCHREHIRSAQCKLGVAIPLLAGKAMSPLKYCSDLAQKIEGLRQLYARRPAPHLCGHVARNDAFRLACVLAVGGLFGILSVLALRSASMPALSSSVRLTWQDAREAFMIKPFRNYLLFVMIYETPFIFAAPYYQVFNLEIPHMKEGLIAYMMVGYQLRRNALYGSRAKCGMRANIGAPARWRELL